MNQGTLILKSKFERWNIVGAFLSTLIGFSFVYALLFIDYSVPHIFRIALPIFFAVLFFFIIYGIIKKNTRFKISSQNIEFQYPWGKSKILDRSSIVGYAFGPKYLGRLYGYGFCIWILNSSNKWYPIPIQHQIGYEQALVILQENELPFLGYLKINEYTGRPYRDYTKNPLKKEAAEQLHLLYNKDYKIYFGIFILFALFSAAAPSMFKLGFEGQMLQHKSLTTVAVFTGYEKRNNLLSMLDPEHKTIRSKYFFIDEKGQLFHYKMPTSSIKYPMNFALRFYPNNPKINRKVGDLKRVKTIETNNAQNTLGHLEKINYYTHLKKKHYLISYSYSIESKMHYGLFVSDTLIKQGSTFNVIYDRENPYFSIIN